MKTIEDEVISELRWLTVEFDRSELLAGHVGVISQGAVRRYFEEINFDLIVKKCGGLKLDSQRDIVTMRFGVVNRPIEKFTKAVMDMHTAVGNVDHAPVDQKLLNPGYDELASQVEGLKTQLELGAEVYDELKEKYDRTKKRYDTLISDFDELKEKYDALIAAVDPDPDAEEEEEEDSADLADAKEVIENDDSVPVSGEGGKVTE